ncbi:MAG: hypothetical protein ABI533_10490 [Betaproteobacteria bacterium]
MTFDLGNLLQKYLNPAVQPSADVSSHFDQVAQHAPPDVMSEGIADALRSDQTPPLGELVSSMFSKSNPQQQAGMLNQILGSLGPGALSSLGGGVLGGLAGALSGGRPQISAQQASQLSPQQVQDITNHAEQSSPDIFGKLGDFYAQHPQLVKTLGSAALTIALAKMANRMRS